MVDSQDHVIGLVDRQLVFWYFPVLTRSILADTHCTPTQIKLEEPDWVDYSIDEVEAKITVR